MKIECHCKVIPDESSNIITEAPLPAGKVLLTKQEEDFLKLLASIIVKYITTKAVNKSLLS